MPPARALREVLKVTREKVLQSTLNAFEWQNEGGFNKPKKNKNIKKNKKNQEWVISKGVK